MARVLRGLGLSAVAMAVLSMAATDLLQEATAGEPGSVIRVLQKSKTKSKKKTKAKKAAKDEMADDAASKDAPAPAAADDGKIKFARDVAPIIVNNCLGCHDGKNGPVAARKLDMSTFEKLMKGTKDHTIIEPGKPDDSHLVLRIKGDETPRMPQTAMRTLSDASIAKIEAWVKAGATLDAGLSPTDPLSKYATSIEDLRALELARLSPEERDKKVEEVAKERWKKASPKTTPEVSSSEHFLLFSNLPKSRADSAVKAVESQYKYVKSLLGAKGVDWGEKASLFVLNDAGSYGELVRTLERREIEAGDVGTAKFNVPEPYVAVIDPLGGREEPAGSAAPSRKSGRSKKGGDDLTGGAERTLAGLLTEQFAAGTAARAGKPPRWLTLGLGAYLASKVDGPTPYYHGLRRNAFGLCQLGWSSKRRRHSATRRRLTTSAPSDSRSWRRSPR